MIKHAGAFFKWLLPIIFIGYFSCVSLFEHAHIVNGVIIVHSHRVPSDDATHQHSSTEELQLFHFLSHFDIQDGAIQSVTIEQTTPLLIGEIVCHWSNPILSSTPWSTASLRAPPTV